MSTKNWQLLFPLKDIYAEDAGYIEKSSPNSRAGSRSSSKSSILDTGHFGRVSEKFFVLPVQAEGTDENRSWSQSNYSCKFSPQRGSPDCPIAVSPSASYDNRMSQYDNRSPKNRSSDDSNENYIMEESCRNSISNDIGLLSSRNSINNSNDIESPGWFGRRISTSTRSSKYGKVGAIASAVRSKSQNSSADEYLTKAHSTAFVTSMTSMATIPAMQPNPNLLLKKPKATSVSPTRTDGIPTLPFLGPPPLTRDLSKLLTRDKSFSHTARSESTVTLPIESLFRVTPPDSPMSPILCNLSSRLLAPTLSSAQLIRGKKEEDDMRPPSPKTKHRNSHRRRSFLSDKYKLERFEANDVCKSISSDGEQIHSEVESDLSTPSTPSINDSWESVSQQPHCDICGMVFKSTILLQKHISWSLLHANNLMKSEPGNEEVEAVVIQEEGVQYRLLYSGSKFYWQTKLMVEIDLYHHIEGSIVEVVAFNHSTFVEMKRLYINAALLSELLEQEIKDNVEAIRKRIMNADRFAKVDTAPLLEQEWRRVVATYVLGRLKVMKVDTSEEEELLFDVPSMPLALRAGPDNNVVPVHVQRRRRTSDDDNVKSSITHTVPIPAIYEGDREYEKETEEFPLIEGVNENKEE